MTRIESIVSYINENDIVADIGCDQVEVGVMLAKKGIKSIGSDISKNVIDKANDKIKKLCLEDFIVLKVGNGLDQIDANINTLVLAGLGTYTILEILSNAKKQYDKIITISNKNNDILRSKMNDLNYRVKSEEIIIEKGIYYNLIVFEIGNRNYNDKELILGINHKNEDMFNKWKKYLIDKYTKINNESKNKNEKVNKILLLLNS